MGLSCSVAPFFPFCFGGCPTKMVFPKKGSPFFPGSLKNSGDDHGTSEPSEGANDLARPTRRLERQGQESLDFICPAWWNATGCLGPQNSMDDFDFGDRSWLAVRSEPHRMCVCVLFDPVGLGVGLEKKGVEVRNWTNLFVFPTPGFG